MTLSLRLCAMATRIISSPGCKIKNASALMRLVSARSPIRIMAAASSAPHARLSDCARLQTLRAHIPGFLPHRLRQATRRSSACRGSRTTYGDAHAKAYGYLEDQSGIRGKLGRWNNVLTATEYVTSGTVTARNAGPPSLVRCGVNAWACRWCPRSSAMKFRPVQARAKSSPVFPGSACAHAARMKSGGPGKPPTISIFRPSPSDLRRWLGLRCELSFSAPCTPGITHFR
jgi:hypothetical protein